MSPPDAPRRRLSFVQKMSGASPRQEVPAQIGSGCYIFNGDIDSTCSESRSGSLRSSDNSGSLSSYTSAKDAIALTVGRSAHHYLQECFTTEVSILDRDKFDAVPEIVKSDLLIAVSHQTTDCPTAAMHARLTTILCCPTLFSGIWEREAIVMFSKSFVKLVT